MSPLRVLFIGGNGTISAEVSRLAIVRGIDLTLLNRGLSSRAPDARPPIEGAHSLVADATDPASMRAALGDQSFDVVVNFRAFSPQQVADDIVLFEGRTGQYVFISSASAYQKPVARLPIVESTPLRNPYWQYSRDKIAGEDLLVAAYRERGFPATIVRPSHTYDERRLPLIGGWSLVERMRQGRPVVVHGDGTSLWTLTHSRDFAVAFVGLLGDPRAIGDSFHITSDEVLTWNAIYRQIGAAAGVPDPELVHIASSAIATELPDLGPGLVGDKAHSVVFDNSKVRAIVPEFTATTRYAEGAREQIAWFDAHPDERVVDAEFEAGIERLIARFG